MANSSVPATAEGMSEDALKLFTQAQDQISECIYLSRLVCNAIEAMELDDDLKALSTGVYAVERKLKESQILLERSKGWPIGH